MASAAGAADGAPSALTLDESVSLGHALVHHLARDAGIRVLFIKGPILAQQSLRPARASVDVDVLVEPARFGDLRVELERLGWRDQGPYSGAFVLPLHSATYKHPLWPCEIDVHERFPGFFADRAAVFEALWARRTTAWIAGRGVPCCDLIGNTAIAALHRLRDPNRLESRRDLEYTASVLRERLDAEGLRELAELAAATGAADTLRPFLDTVGAPEIGTGRTSPEDLRAWRVRTSSSGMKSVPWLVELGRTPAHRWPVTLWRALTLTEREIRRAQPHAKPGRRGLFVARLRRVGWGVRALPKAAGLLWGSRRWGAVS